MSFIQAEKLVMKEKWSMLDLHSHPHYEVFFLAKGNRTYFISNSLYKLTAPAIVFIPPHVMHKSEGDPFERYVLSVSDSYLDKFQRHVLKRKALSVVHLTEKEKDILVALFEELCSVNKLNKFSDEKIKALTGYLLLQINQMDNQTSIPSASCQTPVPTNLLKIIDYLNSNYSDKITLDGLSEKFFISKGTLIYSFNKHMGCSPIDFLLNIRLTKAKELLLNSKLSVEEISETCGFSSANYFSLIFKKKENISPMNYKKNEKAKK